MARRPERPRGGRRGRGGVGLRRRLCVAAHAAAAGVWSQVRPAPLPAASSIPLPPGGCVNGSTSKMACRTPREADRACIFLVPDS